MIAGAMRAGMCLNYEFRGIYQCTDEWMLKGAFRLDSSFASKRDYHDMIRHLLGLVGQNPSKY